MRILVCGGREYDNYSQFMDKMEKLVENYWGDLVIIHGDAKGADFLARIWAVYHEETELRFPANWGKHGKTAGAIRNQQMLDEGKPDIVLAFPGGTGTVDMIRRARKAGVRVVEVGTNE